MDDLALFTAFQHARGLRQHPEMTGLFSRHLGELVVTSGSLMACDPWFCDAKHPFVSPPVAPDRYPVVVAIALFSNGDQRLALAAVIFQQQLAVRWENARTIGTGEEGLAAAPGGFFGTSKEEVTRAAQSFHDARTASLVADEFLGYPVDSGTGCFLDAESAHAFASVLDAHDPGVDDPLITALKAHRVFTWSWANYCVNEETGANIVAFSSGWGDGVYPSFFGYGEDEQLVCLLTDFEVLELQAAS